MQTPFLDKYILGDRNYSSAELKEKFDHYDQTIKELQDQVQKLLETKPVEPQPAVTKVPSLILTDIKNDVTVNLDENGQVITEDKGIYAISGTDLMLMIQEVAKDVSKIKQEITKLQGATNE